MTTESVQYTDELKWLRSLILVACRPDKQAQRPLVRQLLVECLSQIEAGRVACEGVRCGVRWCREDELTTIQLASGVERRYCPECVERQRAAVLAAGDYEPGTVYLVQNPADGLIKIGRTLASLERRLRALRAAAKADHLDVVHVITTRNTYKLERQLHQLFAAKRVVGEWFRLTEADIQLITSGRYEAAVGQGGA